MAHETESTTALVAEVSRDPVFDGAARCALLTQWTRDVPTVLARAEVSDASRRRSRAGSRADWRAKRA